MNDSPISGHARLHAVVTGRVQGVSFRYFVSEQAGAFGLLGWVRNRHDGSVEVTAEGPRPRLEGLLAALWQGPPSARVDQRSTARRSPTPDAPAPRPPSSADSYSTPGP